VLRIHDISFSAYYFFKVHLHHFSKIKSHKEVTKSRNKVFSYYFCLMIEGSGSVPRTNGSGSGSRKPKTIVSYGSGSATLLLGNLFFLPALVFIWRTNNHFFISKCNFYTSIRIQTPLINGDPDCDRNLSRYRVGTVLLSNISLFQSLASRFLVFLLPPVSSLSAFLFYVKLLLFFVSFFPASPFCSSYPRLLLSLGSEQFLFT